MIVADYAAKCFATESFWKLNIPVSAMTLLYRFQNWGGGGVIGYLGNKKDLYFAATLW